MTPWEFEADELVVCNCAYGCPCQFNALPTHGSCEAVSSFEIKRGYFGETRLDGLRTLAIMAWPAAIHEGSGKAFMVIDERADEAQRTALLTILSGGETEPGATIWNVFSATFEEVFDPVFKPIDMVVDVEARTGHVKVEGIAETRGTPILNPVSGEPQRSRISLPNGFEYTLAEMGASSFTTSGPIALSYEDRYAQFAHLHINNNGPMSVQAA
ncbi:MAG: DUF1326 domain-containing protein [Halioglobus sp.]